MDFKIWKNINQRRPAYISDFITDFEDLNKIITNVKSVSKPQINTGGEDDNISFPEDYQDRTSWTIKENDITQNLINNLNNIIISVNQKHFQFDLDRLENINYIEYSSNDKTTLNWHLDIGRYPYNQRKLSFTILVNNPSEYEGGDLEIWQNNEDYLTFPKKQGSIAFFPSFLPHRVTSITKGVRKVIVGFILGSRPYR